MDEHGDGGRPLTPKEWITLYKMAPWWGKLGMVVSQIIVIAVVIYVFVL